MLKKFIIIGCAAAIAICNEFGKTAQIGKVGVHTKYDSLQQAETKNEKMVQQREITENQINSWKMKRKGKDRNNRSMSKEKNEQKSSLSESQSSSSTKSQQNNNSKRSNKNKKDRRVKIRGQKKLKDIVQNQLLQNPNISQQTGNTIV